MGRHKSLKALTPAEKQQRYRARKAAAQDQDSAIADAARILHNELLQNQGIVITIPQKGPLVDTATFLRGFAADIEYARRGREKGGAKKS